MAGFKKLGTKGNVVHRVVLPGPTVRPTARRQASQAAARRPVPVQEAPPAPPVSPVRMSPAPAPAPDASAAEVRQSRRETELLQRRIDKLSRLLTEQEEQIRTLAMRGEEELEAASAPIYNAVKPTLGTDEGSEKRRAVMSQLFQANLELRETVNRTAS